MERDRVSTPAWPPTARLIWAAVQHGAVAGSPATTAALAATTGRSARTVRRWRARLGLAGAGTRPGRPHPVVRSWWVAGCPATLAAQAVTSRARAVATALAAAAARGEPAPTTAALAATTGAAPRTIRRALADLAAHPATPPAGAWASTRVPALPAVVVTACPATLAALPATARPLPPSDSPSPVSPELPKQEYSLRGESERDGKGWGAGGRETPAAPWRVRPATATLTPARHATATACGVPAAAVAAEWEAMADYEYPRPQRDVDRAWRRWCRRAVAWRYRPAPMAPPAAAPTPPPDAPGVDPAIAAALAPLAAVFGRQWTPARQQATAAALADLAPATIQRACTRALRTCRFAPTPAELRALVGAAPPDVGAVHAALLRALSAPASQPLPPLLQLVVTRAGGRRALADLPLPQRLHVLETLLPGCWREAEARGLPLTLDRAA